MFMPFLVAIVDPTHPLQNHRSSTGMIGCLMMLGTMYYCCGNLWFDITEWRYLTLGVKYNGRFHGCVESSRVFRVEY